MNIKTMVVACAVAVAGLVMAAGPCSAEEVCPDGRQLRILLVQTLDTGVPTPGLTAALFEVIECANNSKKKLPDIGLGGKYSIVLRALALSGPSLSLPSDSQIRWNLQAWKPQALRKYKPASVSRL